MTFSGHIAVSVFVLALTQEPFLVVILCFLLHLATDAIPHVDWPKLHRATAREKVVVSADLALTALLTASLFYVYQDNPVVVLLAILFSLLPDLLDSFSRKYFKAFRRLHDSLHTWPLWAKGEIDWRKTVTGRTPVFVKILLQVVLIGIAQGLLFWRIF